MPSFLAIADFLQPQSLELGSTFIYGVRISFESFSGVQSGYAIAVCSGQKAPGGEVWKRNCMQGIGGGNDE